MTFGLVDGLVKLTFFAPWLINLQYTRTAIVFAFVFGFFSHFSKKPVLQINPPYNREV